MTRVVTVGKYRGLQRASTPEGHFTILALDHQDALRRAMRPDAPETVTPDDLVEIKLQIIDALAPFTSGILLDPIYGAAQVLRAGRARGVGLLVELEKADYQLQPMPLTCELLPDWSVAKIKRMGADGVKLFYYDNPDTKTLVAQQDATVRAVAEDCVTQDIPFYAEPVQVAVDENQAMDSNTLTRRVIASARRAATLGADVLKLEFPLAPGLQQDDRLCRDACATVTDSLDVPWVLLSAGVTFESFCRQVEIACAAGASGYIAGRAVWGEAAVIADRFERQRWLETTGRDRLRLLAERAAVGRPWTDAIVCEPVTTSWYQTYAPEAG